LTSDGTLGSNTSAVFTWTSVDDSVYKNLDGVLVGEQVNDFERVCDNSDSHELLSVIAAVHHQAAKDNENLNILVYCWKEHHLWGTKRNITCQRVVPQ
jgi:hypothetical protein